MKLKVGDILLENSSYWGINLLEIVDLTHENGYLIKTFGSKTKFGWPEEKLNKCFKVDKIKLKLVKLFYL